MDELITISITPDASSAVLSIPACAAPESATVHRIFACVEASGVAISPTMQEHLGEIAESFAREPRDLRVEIAHSTPPRDGRDARIVWTEGLDPTHPPEPVRSADGAIDHYQQPHFLQVKEGDVLAEVFAETVGDPGCDVRGRAIKPRHGRKLTLKFDDASTKLECGRLVARITGVLQVVLNKVSVTDLLEVAEDVDFSTASLNSRGSVAVRGAVRDRFSITAGKNIQVAGLVEGARLDAGGDIVLLRGMAARHAGGLKAAGGLTAGFLNSARIEIAGSLTLGREMIGCEAIIGGDLEGPSATLMGGTVSVTGSVCLATIGSPGEVATTIHLGSAPLLSAKRSEFQKAIAAIDRAMLVLRDRAAMYESIGKSQTASDKEKLTECHYDLDERLRRRVACEEAIVRLDAMIERVRRVDFRVMKIIHPNVRIETDDAQATIGRAIKGPVTIGWDQERNLMISVAGGPARPIGEFATQRAKAA